MRLFGLIGCPLGHSFSEKYFADKFIRENIKGCVYRNFPITTVDDFLSIVDDNPDLEGVNVTIPYKTSILKYIDIVDPCISGLDAVNVVKVVRQGHDITFYGYNTDIAGIRESVSPYRNSIGHAMIFGTGGASKAVSFVLRDMGVNVHVVSRSRKDNAIGYDDINGELMDGMDLLVNATPVGMFPNVELRLPFNYGLLKKHHILFDLVYNPEITEFLKAGQNKGCRIITGMTMFKVQAEETWKIWNARAASS